MDRFTVALPARLESSRLPRKLLLNETGKYLIEHTLENLAALREVADLVVVTDSDEIHQAVKNKCDRVFVSQMEHRSGSSRLAEFADEFRGPWVLNVQADEPEADSNELLELMKRLHELEEFPMGTMGAPFVDEKTWQSPHAVKVVVSNKGRAMTFSRAPLPFGGNHAHPQVLHHVGVYAYRRQFLKDWPALPISELEKAENLEQMRALESDVPIWVRRIAYTHKGIDTREDYEAFVSRM